MCIEAHVVYLFVSCLALEKGKLLGEGGGEGRQERKGRGVLLPNRTTTFQLPTRVMQCWSVVKARLFSLSCLAGEDYDALGGDVRQARHVMGVMHKGGETAASGLK